MNKVKFLHILTNGSIFFTYKNYNYVSINYNFLEKDVKNFHYNLKLNEILTKNASLSNYKNKFLI